MKAYIAANECPMPCTEVVFAKCKATSQVFAVCTSCGCAWFAPQHEKWEMGNLGNCEIDCRKYAPKGFVLATLEEIRTAGLEEAVVGERDGEEWKEHFDWYNRRYYGNQ